MPFADVDIIIPHYGVGRPTELALTCLRTIREYSKNYRLILVDNGSPEYDALVPELERHQRLLVVRNRVNLGFIKAVNEGIWLSTAPWVVLMNNDTEAVPHWLERLKKGFISPEVGLVGPRTTTPNSWQGRWVGRNGTIILQRKAMLAFFCTMFRRQVFDKVGVLDEEFGLGFGDDDWYCYKAHKAGFRLALVQDLKIPHHHRSTFQEMFKQEEIKAMQTKALERFHQKCRESR